MNKLHKIKFLQTLKVSCLRLTLAGAFRSDYVAACSTALRSATGGEVFL